MSPRAHRTTSNSGSQAERSSTKPKAERLIERISADSFRGWYRERQYRRNIENGTPYFNEEGYIPNPNRHTPSQLLQCHRKIIYRQQNAPEEQPAPSGIFWFGTRFEEDIAFPFLERAVTGQDTYVQNTMWIDVTVETEVGDLRIKGATDPVIVDSEAVPVLPTEIKTKSDLDSLTGPSRHHKAQLHAYMYGLSEKFDVDVTQGVLLYGGRQSLKVRMFPVEFDESFWQDAILDWAREHTQFRLDGELPAASPEYDWECGVCQYRDRCGRGDARYADADPEGLLPHYSEYPRGMVREYLNGHEDAMLTPTLAAVYPDLAEQWEVHNWECHTCERSIVWNDVDLGDDPDKPPVCPHCAARGELATLNGPTLAFQRASRGSRDA